MRVKTDKRDTVFSLLVRERAGWRCEVCGTRYDPENAAGLQCSHFFTRSKRSTRWAAENAAAQCTACHMRMGGNPIEFAEWIKGYLGEERYDALRRKANTPHKYTKADLEDLYQKLKSELASMRAKRAAGVTGRIEFSS